MLSGDFARKLRKLNPELKIYCGNSNTRPASLYHVINSKEITICGVDKNEVPQNPIYDEVGHVIKSGWVRVLNILIRKGIVTKSRAERIFCCHLYNTPQPTLKEMYKNIAQYHPDDLREIGSTL